MSQEEQNQRELIMDQFTKQADSFAARAASEPFNQVSIDLLLQRVSLNGKESVLDVACGPGLLALGLAPKVKKVTGIDLVPAMLEKARAFQEERGVDNAEWVLGDVNRLPFQDLQFHGVVSRFSLHHNPDPAHMVDEMIRVAKKKGWICVIDIAPSEDKAEAFNHFEKLRDPSHARALSVPELKALARGAGLKNISLDFCSLERELESQLAASFPLPGNLEKIRQLFEEDPLSDKMGVQIRRVNGSIYYSYPVTLLVGYL
jgi:ubiquinone/menaquinone biosynthesis C-methylase UbiE